MKPYIDEVQFDLFEGKKHYRTFLNDVSNDELVWHRDKKNREVFIIESKKWEFQMDNELPFEMKPGHLLEIEKETYHRLHKGNGELIIEIEEHE